MSAILVVRPSSLGDIVHSLSLVADVARHRPGTQIDWVSEESFAPLVGLHPGIRRVIPVALRRWRRTPFARAAWREIAAFRHDLRRECYDAVIDLQEQVKGAVIARFARGVRHGPDRANIREPMATLLHSVHHAIDSDQHLIDRARGLAAAALGYVADGPPRFGIVAPPPSLDDAAPNDPYVVFLHATSRDEKLWPEAHWSALIGHFARNGFIVVLPWGSEPERERSVRLAGDEAAVRIPPRRSLPQVAGLLARAELVVGVDTGLAHLAAALGTPTIALFLATSPRLAGVQRASTTSIDLGDAGSPPIVAEVLDAAGDILRRSPRF